MRFNQWIQYNFWKHGVWLVNCSHFLIIYYVATCKMWRRCFWLLFSFYFPREATRLFVQKFVVVLFLWFIHIVQYLHEKCVIDCPMTFRNFCEIKGLFAFIVFFSLSLSLSLFELYICILCISCTRRYAYIIYNCYISKKNFDRIHESRQALISCEFAVWEYMGTEDV